VSGPLVSAPLLGGRVLELAPKGRTWRLSVTQIDGKYRRQVGGFDLTKSSSPVRRLLKRLPRIFPIIRYTTPTASGEPVLAA